MQRILLKSFLRTKNASFIPYLKLLYISVHVMTDTGHHQLLKSLHWKHAIMWWQGNPLKIITQKLHERNVRQQAQPFTTYNMYCFFPGRSCWIIEGELYATNLWPLTDTRTIDSNLAVIERAKVTFQANPLHIKFYCVIPCLWASKWILSSRKYEIPVTAAI